MELLTQAQYKRLLRNGQVRKALCGDNRKALDFYPVVKLYRPDERWIFLLTEVDPDNPDIAFGLYERAFTSSRYGLVSLEDLARVRFSSGTKMLCDHSFIPEKTISEYYREASELGYINA